MSSLAYKHLTVIYHSRDMDGWTSAAILRKQFPGCALIGYDYGEPIPTIPEETAWIIIVDVCVEPWQMRQLASIAKYGITYIDHHQSSIDKIENDLQANGAYLIGKVYDIHREKLAACELTWRHCYPTAPLPLYVELIGSADAARNTTRYPNNESRNAFLTTLGKTFVSPDTCPSWVLEKQDDITSLGHDENRKGFKQRHEYCITHSFEETLLGLRALCLEVPKLGYENFDGIAIDAYDMRIAFMYDSLHNHWKCSIYTNPIKHNAAELAQKIANGGGHPNAAGFQVDDITTILPNYKKQTYE